MRTLAALLALVLVISVSAQYGPTTEQCCTKYYSHTIPQKKVESYFKTGSSCYLTAIVLKTEKKMEFCVKPDLPWVQNIVTNLGSTASPL
ncbi:C-C motif chemokine 3-like isoform X2 [Alosa sapidissima]|uniref:C-C motif chemokine 3-like isoform X1 n=1 Tax=Alosa sapidissima TaxID=34773 RepID=UPI001C094957|nr:C-C motif chemokine 3-like isoform X1 [Alosa sapidissima]XP_041966506.1 C-C motif chemokine 3-like isoform X2 [Alosa sapidissima]